MQKLFNFHDENRKVVITDEMAGNENKQESHSDLFVNHQIIKKSSSEKEGNK